MAVSSKWFLFNEASPLRVKNKLSKNYALIVGWMHHPPIQPSESSFLKMMAPVIGG